MQMQMDAGNKSKLKLQAAQATAQRQKCKNNKHLTAANVQYEQAKAQMEIQEIGVLKSQT